jgi:hypothetical protein
LMTDPVAVSQPSNRGLVVFWRYPWGWLMLDAQQLTIG